MPPSVPLDSATVRGHLVEALALDLVGPNQNAPLANEVLYQSPSRWYLTGFLSPVGTELGERASEEAPEEVEVGDERGAADDAGGPDRGAARTVPFPSSMGLSVLLPSEAKQLRVGVSWGDYRRGTRDGGGVGWFRTPRTAEVRAEVRITTAAPESYPVPESSGLEVVVSVRHAPPVEEGAASEALAVSVFLVNRRRPALEENRDEAYAFQAELHVECERGFLPRPNRRGVDSAEWDERVADLQYRDAFEYAVGHGVSAAVEMSADGSCNSVRSNWLPVAQVERVMPAEVPGVELSMEALGQCATSAEIQERLGALATGYRKWLGGQSGALSGASPRRKAIAAELLARAESVASRIEAGLTLLATPVVFEAFKTANRAMAAAARRREAIARQAKPSEVAEPRWYPFQLAFLLMNLPGVVDPTHVDRETVDLLFFPTGGGKTEAYLGLAAFTLVLRRLRNPGLTSAGVTVLMRYTLRLLTLDQLGRAAALICALELEREANTAQLGTHQFQVGLWVGRAATPNRMGRKGDNDPESARAKTIAFQNDDRRASPIPVENCPWCGEKFTRNSFKLRPNPDTPTDLDVYCANRTCEFSGTRALPMLGVDEPIYGRLPCFLIATVDKFAAMPWTAQVGLFFGGATRHDALGFYGPSEGPVGTALEAPLPPPELIIQDELHLISGPMGTMVGLYETALDGLCARGRIRAKIVASTATVRRAERQIQALFDRRIVEIFPPPGPDRRDSFFAETAPADKVQPRLYVGVAGQGRSPKVILLRTYLALLGAAQRWFEVAGGTRTEPNPADPYMSLLGYFNSLRELGGSRRIVEDEINYRVQKFADRRRVGEAQGSFADRKIARDVLELTSRVGTDEVAHAKRRLALPFSHKEHVDIALATNMISVGLDITRLGLMVVFGQPKTTAEYIQTTSRVGRDRSRPGLVVTMLNIHKPRDRSHYERFTAYHESFYRSVEVSSVTPFSPRALDRGLAGTAVALARHGDAAMTPPLGASEIQSRRGALEWVVGAISARASAADRDASPEDAEALRKRVQERANDLLDEWVNIASDYAKDGVALQYQEEVGAAQRLLRDFLDPELDRLPPRHRKFRANRSMRDVEPSVNLWLRSLADTEVAGADS